MLLNLHISLLKSPKCLSLLQACQDKNKIIYDTLELMDGEKVIPLGLMVTPKKDQGAILVLQDKSNLFQIIDMGKAFIANASHELKTPITVIRGFAETLQDHPELDQVIQNDMTDKILRNCHRMEILVKNLLTLTDIENLPRSQLKECELKSCLHDCLSSIHAINSEATVEFTEPNNKGVFVLGENAIKYNQSKPQIKLSLLVDDQVTKIIISDNGIGIPPKDLPHIFERFYRVDKARSRKLGGSGLGLSIVKTIIDKLKGTISVDSKQNEGTTFTITFPLLDPSNQNS